MKSFQIVRLSDVDVIDSPIYPVCVCCLELGNLLLMFLRLSQQSNKVPVVQHAHHVHPLTPLITYSNEHFSPGTPPSHLSPEILDPKTGKTVSSGPLFSVGLPSDTQARLPPPAGIPRTPHPSELSPYYPLSPGAVGSIAHPLGWFMPQ